MHYKIAQVALSPGKNASTTGDIFIAQPDTHKENLAGKLFILVEINSKSNNNLKIISFLIDNINHNYYQNEKLILRERISTLKVEHIFEAALARTNKDLLRFLKKEKLINLLKTINITIGLIHDDTLHFTNSGKNKVLLVYKAPKAPSSAHPRRNRKSTEDVYKISEISQEPKNNSRLISENTKLFTNVVSGEIPPKGYFIITNEALPEYISNKQLTSIIATLPPIGAVEQIKNTLSKINSYVSFMGIVIKSTTFEPPQKFPNSSHVPAQNHMDELNSVEAKTENLLTPSGIINIKQGIKIISEAFTDLIPRNKQTNSNLLLKDKIIVKKRSENKIKNLALKSKNILSIFTHGFTFFTNLLPRKDTSITNKKAKTSLKIKFPTRKFSFKNKALLVTSLIFISIFTYNLITTKSHNKQVEQQVQKEGNIALIKQKQNKIEASLLYNGSNTKELLPEIKALIEELNPNSKEEIAIINKLKQRYEKQTLQVRKITQIENPEEITNLSKLNQDANPQNLILINESNTIYAADASQSSIYSINLSDNIATSIFNTEQTIDTLDFPILTKNNDVYYLNDDQMIALNTATEQTKTKTIGLRSNKKDMIATDIYNNRLYILSPENDQILKHILVDTGYSKAANWITDGTSIDNAIDISIDGNIFILKKNGEIIKFLKGQKHPFVLKPTDPLLNNANKLFVSPEQNFIYVLDKNENRIVLFSKNKGLFIKQFKFPSLSNIKDFIVAEESNTIYILNESSIYKIELTE